MQRYGQVPDGKIRPDRLRLFPQNYGGCLRWITTAFVGFLTDMKYLIAVSFEIVIDDFFKVVGIQDLESETAFSACRMTVSCEMDYMSRLDSHMQ